MKYLLRTITNRTLIHPAMYADESNTFLPRLPTFRFEKFVARPSGGMINSCHESTRSALLS